MSDIHEGRQTAITVSANQPQLSRPSTLAMTAPFDRLKPIGERAGSAELMACLTLVAPSGMSAEDRQAWVAVAKQTLTGIPADLLQRGCKRARETCRFASEIVPAIMADAKADWEFRKRTAAILAAQEANRDAPRLEHNPDMVRPEQIRELIQSLSKAA